MLFRSERGSGYRRSTQVVKNAAAPKPLPAAPARAATPKAAVGIDMDMDDGSEGEFERF